MSRTVKKKSIRHDEITHTFLTKLVSMPKRPLNIVIAEMIVNYIQYAHHFYFKKKAPEFVKLRGDIPGYFVSKDVGYIIELEKVLEYGYTIDLLIKGSFGKHYFIEFDKPNVSLNLNEIDKYLPGLEDTIKRWYIEIGEKVYSSLKLENSLLKHLSKEYNNKNFYSRGMTKTKSHLYTYFVFIFEVKTKGSIKNISEVIRQLHVYEKMLEDTKVTRFENWDKAEENYRLIGDYELKMIYAKNKEEEKKWIKKRDNVQIIETYETEADHVVLCLITDFDISTKWQYLLAVSGIFHFNIEPYLDSE